MNKEALPMPDDPRPGEQESFASLAATFKPLVEARLVGILDTHVARAAAHGAEIGAIIEAARALTLRGGKRVRAVLVAAAFQACGGEQGPSAVVMAGAAIELLHAYLLIHDDWMDQDTVRRGGPTVHVQLGALLASERDGAAAAILAGDYLGALAVEALLAVELPAPRVRDAAAILVRALEEVVLGQALDIRHRPDIDVETMHDLKTASYTVRAPLLVGAVLAGAAPRALETLEAYARPAGVAFQLHDDLLGTFGDARVTGKPVGNNLREGKRTALIEELASDPRSQPLLGRVLGRRDASPEDVEALTALLVSSGAQARVQARQRQLLLEARRSLLAGPGLPGDALPLFGALSAFTAREQ
jgi:geranylgeranyl diphosphate synthase type I